MTSAKGLEGIVVAQTHISHVFGEEGRLVYRGYEIGELAGKATFEEVCHLLWKGTLPTRAELEALNGAMRAQRALPDGGAGLRLLSTTVDPMDALRTEASLVAALLQIKGAPTVEQAMALTARFPTIVAAFHRLRSGLEPIAPRQDLGHAANYLYMLTGEVPPENHIHSLDTYFVLLADHGMNASTFTARVIASTESDLGSSIVGAIGALKGPLHGGAPALVMDMLEAIGSADNIKPWVDNALNTHQKLMGFGHRVYKTTDPRAEILRVMAKQASTPEFFALAKGTEDYAIQELNRRKPDQRLYTNVEFYSAAVLNSVGLPRDLYPATFGISRVAGWTAHVLEQMVGNRLIRPQSEYVGPQGLKFAPVEERGMAAIG
ncbi:MAG TPA: citrate synthase/methylcitrate synthase [Ktedonobacterales bacterium]|nr:citrate synthase/methylcitrate synthase [Ktedonobacterales bacterium]